MAPALRATFAAPILPLPRSRISSPPPTPYDQIPERESNRAGKRLRRPRAQSSRGPFQRTRNFAVVLYSAPDGLVTLSIKIEFRLAARSEIALVSSSLTVSTSFSIFSGSDLFRVDPRQGQMRHIGSRFPRRLPAVRANLRSSPASPARFGEASTPHQITRGRRSFGKNPTPRNCISTGRSDRIGSSASANRIGLRPVHMADKFQRDVNSFRPHPASAVGTAS